MLLSSGVCSGFLTALTDKPCLAHLRIVPLMRAVSTLRLGSNVSNPVPQSPSHGYNDNAFVSELDLCTFFGECTRPSVSAATLQRFCLGHGSSAVTLGSV